MKCRIWRAQSTLIPLLCGVLFVPLTSTAQTNNNPVTSAAREILVNREKNMVAAAEEMPDGKYDYKPTPQQITFGHLIEHIAKSNNFLCSKLSGEAAPQQQVSEKDGKTKLVAALRSSFDYCSGALHKLDDSRLGDAVELFGNRKSTKAGAVLSLTADWADHYSAAAMYLRLSGMLPPTAKEKE